MRSRTRRVVAVQGRPKKVDNPLDTAPRGGQYAVSIISLSLRLIINASCSLRGVAATLAVFVERGWASFAVPCFSTIRSWLLRVGYRSLTRPLDTAESWLWLVDHTIQIGTMKLLVILGCPMSQVPFGERALRLSDLQLVALVPMDKSNGEAVAIELRHAAERTGVPRQIASDQGPDLRKGISLFVEQHAETAPVPDIAHYGANLLEQAWADDPRWQQFVQQMQETSSKLRQTKAAYLLAPRMRPKARFMNVATLLKFSRRVLKHLHSDSPREKAVDCYSWLKAYDDDDLTAWEREQWLVQTTIERVRVQGLHRHLQPELDAAWGEIGTRASTVRIAQKLREYVTTYQPPTDEERFVASTEILESSFGKLKRIEDQQSQDGLTALSLSLGAVVGTQTDADIREALDATPQKHVDRWTERVLGHSIQWHRQQFFREATSVTKAE